MFLAESNLSDNLALGSGVPVVCQVVDVHRCHHSFLIQTIKGVIATVVCFPRREPGRWEGAPEAPAQLGMWQSITLFISLEQEIAHGWPPDRQEEP
jgi:hypothetical protein